MREKNKDVEEIIIEFKMDDYEVSKEDLDKIFQEGEKVRLRKKEKKIILDKIYKPSNPYLGLQRALKERLSGQKKESDDIYPPYIILEKRTYPIKRDGFVLMMSLGFISVWVIYAVIKWVIVFYIVGGFKSK
jgi:hypothetical protein